MYTLGYYTGWAIAIVLLFVMPLMVVCIIYLKTINHQLADIQAKLLALLPTREHNKSVEDGKRDTKLK